VLQLAGSQPLSFHFAHGDFTPWNMIVSDLQIGLFDFEYALQSAPAGFDLFHFQLRKSILIDKKSAMKFYHEYESKNGWYRILNEYFQQLKIDEQNRQLAIKVSVITYLIHSLCIYEKFNSMFERNVKTYSYLLNSLLIDNKLC
jgi:thiamine kinase-like enzyme